MGVAEHLKKWYRIKRFPKYEITEVFNGQERPYIRWHRRKWAEEHAEAWTHLNYLGINQATYYVRRLTNDEILKRIEEIEAQGRHS